MGWETRNGRRYYYEAERVGRRVVKRYFGAGRLAELCAQINALDADRRKWNTVERDLAAARRSRVPRAARLVRAADAVLAVWLPRAGLHRPNRGPWRRKRGFVMTDLALAERRPLDSWDTVELWRRNGSVPADLLPPDGKKPKAAVAAYLKDHPAAVALYGDLARHTVKALADKSGGEETLPAAAIMARAEALRRELAGAAPTAVELILAERAVVCWAAAHNYELLYFTSMEKGRPVKEHLWMERRMDAAHRRLLAALKALAAVRRMRLPDLIAVVHVTGGSAAPSGRATSAIPADY